MVKQGMGWGGDKRWIASHADGGVSSSADPDSGRWCTALQGLGRSLMGSVPTSHAIGGNDAKASAEYADGYLARKDHNESEHIPSDTPL